MMWQRQKGGDNSALMQANSINIGVGLQDVEYISKKMAIEVFSAYSRDAFQLMSERVEEFAQTYIEHVLRKSPESIENIKDPGVQSAILDAESAYAKTGDNDLGSLLIDILTARTANMERNVVQLALSESISVAQKLTSEQYSSLSLIFLLRHVKFNSPNIPNFHQRVRENLAPVAEEAAVSNTDAQHLVATGCAVFQPFPSKIQEVILRTYPGLFCTGLDRDDVTVKQLPIEYFGPCLRDPSKVQVSFIDAEALKSRLDADQVTPEHRQTLENLLSTNQLSHDELIVELTKVAPVITRVHEKWEKSSFGQLTLTSVGIVLAHSNVLRITQGSFDAPLKVFLPEN